MKLELKIIGLLAKDTEKKFTINEIARTLNEHYSLVHRTVNKLAKEGVIAKNKVGKSYVCSVNAENEKTFALMQLSEIEKREEMYNANKELRIILDDFIESLRKDVEAVILFGSYAKGQETRESDIDILLITKKKLDIDKITRNIYAKYGKEISPITLSPADFEKQRDKAIIKEVMNYHYVLRGTECFVRMVFGK